MTTDQNPQNYASGDDEIDLIALLQTLWAAKFTIVGITSLFAVLGVAYALLATPWYQAEVTLAPKQQDATAGLTSQLGGLASLAGFGGVGDDLSIEAIATLQSRELARSFIEDHELLTRIFADRWNAETGTWEDEDPLEQPDVRDAVEFFQKKMLTVSQDRKTLLISLALRWTDPQEAAAWAEELVRRVNTQMRERAAQEAETNLHYLNKELASTNVVNLQQSISRLIENEMQKLMIARNSEDYAVRTIDAAQVPRRPAHPRKLIVVLASTMAGGVFSLLWLAALHVYRSTKTGSP